MIRTWCWSLRSALQLPLIAAVLLCHAMLCYNQGETSVEAMSQAYLSVPDCNQLEPGAHCGGEAVLRSVRAVNTQSGQDSKNVLGVSANEVRQSDAAKEGVEVKNNAPKVAPHSDASGQNGTGSVKIKQMDRNSMYISLLPYGEEYSHKLEQYSGHIVVGESGTNTMFFWLMKAAHLVGKKKLILWFNGGPGCSSMSGAVLEIGPFKFTNPQSGFKLVENTADVTHHASVLFVDQPAGVGLSIQDASNPYPKTYKEWIAAFLEFFKKFMDMFPEFTGADVYLSGESYAGYYNPHLSLALLENIDMFPQLKITDIKGIIVGNPYFDPMSHYESYLPFLARKEVLPKEYIEKLAPIEKKCIESAKPKFADWNNMLNEDIYCMVTYMNEITDASIEVNGEGNCINIYNVALTDTECGMAWPSHAKDVTKYFADKHVVKNLHIDVPGLPTKVYDECSSVNKTLLDGFYNSHPGVYIMSKLLTDYKSFKVVIFEGDNDLICNVDSVTKGVSRIRIGDAPLGMDKFSHYDWYVEDSKVGEFYKYENMEYYIIHGGSHMPSTESPKQLYDLYLRSTGVEGEGPKSSMVNVSSGGSGGGTSSKVYIATGVAACLASVSAVTIFGIRTYRKQRLQLDSPNLPYHTPQTPA